MVLSVAIESFTRKHDILLVLQPKSLCNKGRPSCTVFFPLAINHRYEIGVGNTYMSVLRNSQMIYHRGGKPERAMHC